MKGTMYVMFFIVAMVVIFAVIINTSAKPGSHSNKKEKPDIHLNLVTEPNNGYWDRVKSLNSETSTDQNYVTDESGNPVTDEQGNPITIPAETDELGSPVTIPAQTDNLGNPITEPEQTDMFGRPVSDKKQNPVTEPLVTDKYGNQVSESATAPVTQVSEETTTKPAVVILH